MQSMVAMQRSKHTSIEDIKGNTPYTPSLIDSEITHSLPDLHIILQYFFVTDYFITGVEPLKEMRNDRE